MAASMASKILHLSRATQQPLLLGVRNFHVQCHPLLFKATQELYMSHILKKRKKLDPAVVMGRLNRKKKILEREIRKLEKNDREYKPIEEIHEYPVKAKEQAKGRKREKTDLSFEECEERALLTKEWSRYKSWQSQAEKARIFKAIAAQQNALNELRKESEELYQQAIQLDNALLSFNFSGVTRTPPIEGFDAPDGDYVNTSKKYEQLSMPLNLKVRKRKRMR